MKSLFTLQSELASKVAVNSWLPLCRTSDLMENVVHNVQVFDKSVNVVNVKFVKNSAKCVYEVFDDKCPHRGAKLSCGVVEMGCVRCPYHGMEFDLEDGRCAGFVGDYDTKKIKAKLHKYETLLFDSLVWTYLGEGHPPEFMADNLQEFMTDTEDDFSSIYGQRDIDCNLFEVEENLLDSLHVGVVHSWGNPESLPESTIKSTRGNFFFYKSGESSLARWLGNKKDFVVNVYNGFSEPLSTLSRVSFGAGLTKVVRVHLLPLDEHKTRVFWGLHRNFMKASWMDEFFRFFVERTLDEDKEILENLASRRDASRQTLTEFDWIIVQYRKKVQSYLEQVISE